MKKILFWAILSLCFLLGTPISAHAISVGGYFGGRVITRTPCLDGITSLVTVSGPVAGAFAYVPGVATLYNNKTVFTGRWVIGSYLPGGVCMTPLGPVPLKGTIKMIGTS